MHFLYCYIYSAGLLDIIKIKIKKHTNVCILLFVLAYIIIKKIKKGVVDLSKFYELNQCDPDERFGASFIELDKADFVNKMYMNDVIALDNETLKTLEICDITYYANDDDPIEEEQFKEYDIWSSCYNMDSDVEEFVKGNIDLEELMGNLKEEGMEFDEEELKKYIREEILKNKIDNFEVECITTSYWDGNNNKELLIWSEYYDNTFVEADSDGDSKLPKEVIEELENLKEITCNQYSTGSDALFVGPSGGYYYSHDSRWQGDIEGKYWIYRTVYIGSLKELLDETFDMTLEELERAEKEAIGE